MLRAAEQSGVLQRDGFANPSVWLRRSTSLTHAEAGRRGKVVRRLHALPEIALALEDGRIGVAHASLIDRLAGDVGVDHVAAVQHPLIVAAVRLRDVAEFATLCAGWRHALAPDYLDERDDKNWEHRRAGFATTNGRGQLWGSFDAHGSALFAAAVDALMTEDGPEIPEDARRTREQRVADAITDMAARVLDAGDTPEKAGQRPHVTVTLGADTLAGEPDAPPAHVDWVGAVGRRTALDLLDDCSITRVLLDQGSQPMDVGTATRVWPAGIRKAVTTRDGHCRFPGCDRPSVWCQIDHVHPVEERGPTCVTNGILLCRPHHRMKRRDGWWPTLHPDGTVTWTHPDHEPRVTRPAAHLQDWVQTLIHYPQRDCHNDSHDQPDQSCQSHDDDLAGETGGFYDTGGPVEGRRAGTKVEAGPVSTRRRAHRRDRKPRPRPPPRPPTPRTVKDCRPAAPATAVRQPLFGVRAVILTP